MCESVRPYFQSFRGYLYHGENCLLFDIDLKCGFLFNSWKNCKWGFLLPVRNVFCRLLARASCQSDLECGVDSLERE